MKFRSSMTIFLLTVGMLAACAPAASPDITQPPATVQPAPQDNEPSALPTPLPTENAPEVAPTDPLPTEALAEVPQIAATSRGPDLESTDPATVSLASGDLQLVEFFRFT